MQVKAKVNLIYGGEIYSRGKVFECDEKFLSSMKSRGLIESEEIAELPSLDEELGRWKDGKKKRN